MSKIQRGVSLCSYQDEMFLGRMSVEDAIAHAVSLGAKGNETRPEAPLTLDEMETAYDRRWAFGAKTTIPVEYPGGFPAGEYALSLTEQLRISYLPFPDVNSDTKRVTAGEAAHAAA